MSNVTIYSTPTCYFCKKAKEFFKKNNIQYDEVNVSESEKSLDDFVKMSGSRAVPVIVINGEQFLGYDEEVLKKKLAISTKG